MSFISEKVWLQDFNSVKSNVNILSVFCKSLLPIGWEDTGREKCEALYKIDVGVTQSGDLLYLPGIQLRGGERKQRVGLGEPWIQNQRSEMREPECFPLDCAVCEGSLSEASLLSREPLSGARAGTWQSCGSRPQSDSTGRFWKA